MNSPHQGDNNNYNNNNALTQNFTNGFQRSRNMYLEEENQLGMIVENNTNIFSQHFQTFLDKTIASLDVQFEKCEALLHELQQQSFKAHNDATNDGGLNAANNNAQSSYWNERTIIEHCNLHLSDKRLLKYQLTKWNSSNGGIGNHQKGDSTEGNSNALPDASRAVNNNTNSSNVEGGKWGGQNGNTSNSSMNNNNDLTAESSPSLSNLIQLINTLEKLRNSAFVTPKQKAFINKCCEKFRVIFFEPQDFKYITNALQVKLKEDGNTKTIFTDLINFQNSVESLTPEIQKCENLLEMSIKNGEMGLAEAISKRQLELYEHTLHLITDQYPSLFESFAEQKNADRRRRWSIFRMADKDISSVMEAKYKLIEACQEDLTKISNQLDNYSKDDLFQRKRYELDKQQSDEFLRQNKEKQQSVWNRVFELLKQFQACENELVTLSRERKREVDRRVGVEDRESSRRSGQLCFVQAAESHSENLLQTIDNAESARQLLEELNAFILDNCNSIAEKYDRQQQTLGDMLRVVQQYHFAKFSDYYVAAHRLLYRKEKQLARLDEQIENNNMKREIYSETLDPHAKKYADENETLLFSRRELEEEISSLQSKLERAEKHIEPTLRALTFANVAFVHPREIVEKMILTRWETILKYKEEIHNSTSGTENAAFLGTNFSTKEHEDEVRAIEALRSTLNAKHQIKEAGSYVSDTAVMKGGVGNAGLSAMNNSSLNSSKMPVRPTSPSRPPQSVFSKRVQQFLDRQVSVRDEEHDVKTADYKLESLNRKTNKSNYAMSYNSSNNNNKIVEGAIFKALYTYEARAPDELSFAEGDAIVCISKASEEGWLKGVSNQRTGLFPLNYVTLEDEQNMFSRTSPT